MRWVGSLFFIASACGSHADDDIPQDLLDAIAQGDETAGTEYPSGPKGGEVGDLAPNVCVTGWLDPQAAEFEPSAAEPICFADFYDPEASAHRFLLVNTGAIWCSACQAEYQGSGTRPSLAEEVAEREERGLRVLGTLFQDAALNPAQLEHGVLWAQSFEVDFPFGIDPDFQMGAFASADVQPFNMLLDTATMRVVLRVQGDNPDELWPAIDERLDSE